MCQSKIVNQGANKCVDLQIHANFQNFNNKGVVKAPSMEEKSKITAVPTAWFFWRDDRLVGVIYRESLNWNHAVCPAVF